MPNNIVKSFADKTGKSVADVEDYWNKAKKVVADEYPDVEKDSDKFYKLLTGVLKKMLSIKTENEGDAIGGIKYGDVSPGTTAGLTTYHTQKRKLKKCVSECMSKFPVMTKEELGVFNALQKEGNPISITMIEQAISTDQLKESISSISIGDTVDTSKSEDMMYLDSAIKEAISDKQNFAGFVEEFSGRILGARNLNESGFEYHGYDLIDGCTYISVKSSSSKHTVNEAFRNSNSVKTSALILSVLRRMDESKFKDLCSFNDIGVLSVLRDELIDFVESEGSMVRFAVSYISKDNEFCLHVTEPVPERRILEAAFERIEECEGKARSKFFSSFSKLSEFCGGDSVTKVKLMDDSEYAQLRENIIKTISNVKDYNLMRKIEMLLR